MLSYNYVNAFYNGETVVFALYGTLGSADELTELGEIVHSVERRERSRAMADYSYAELCLALDSLYGLKDSHSFTDFDSLFDQTGLFMGLKSTIPRRRMKRSTASSRSIWTISTATSPCRLP